MGSTPDHVDRELDRLLSFRDAEEGSPELRSLLVDLETAFPTRALDAEAIHLAAMVDAAHLHAENGDPVVRPVSNADAPAPQVSRLPKQRRNEVRDVKRILLTKVIAPLAAVMLMSGMAFAGVLPGPLQDTVDGVFGGAPTEEPDDDVLGSDDDELELDDEDADEPRRPEGLEDPYDDDEGSDEDEGSDDDETSGGGTGNGHDDDEGEDEDEAQDDDHGTGGSTGNGGDDDEGDDDDEQELDDEDEDEDGSDDEDEQELDDEDEDGDDEQD